MAPPGFGHADDDGGSRTRARQLLATGLVNQHAVRETDAALPDDLPGWRIRNRFNIRHVTQHLNLKKAAERKRGKIFFPRLPLSRSLSEIAL